MSPAELAAWATVAIAVFIGGVGATTCFLVWHGIREMRRSSDERARDRKAAEEADIRRHETAAEQERLRHEEVMEAITAQNRRFDAQTDVLKALIPAVVDRNRWRGASLPQPGSFVLILSSDRASGRVSKDAQHPPLSLDTRLAPLLGMRRGGDTGRHLPMSFNPAPLV